MFNFINEGFFQETKNRIIERWEYRTKFKNEKRKLLYINLDGFKYDTMWLDINDFLEYKKKIIIYLNVGWELEGQKYEILSEIPIL